MVSFMRTFFFLAGSVFFFLFLLPTSDAQTLNVYYVNNPAHTSAYSFQKATVIVRYHYSGGGSVYASVWGIKTSGTAATNWGNLGCSDGATYTVETASSRLPGVYESGFTSCVVNGVSVPVTPITLTWIPVDVNSSGAADSSTFTFYQDVYLTPATLSVTLNIVVSGGTNGASTAFDAYADCATTSTYLGNVTITPGMASTTRTVDASAWEILGLAGDAWHVSGDDGLVWVRPEGASLPQWTWSYSPTIVPAAGGIITATLTVVYPPNATPTPTPTPSPTPTPTPTPSPTPTATPTPSGSSTPTPTVSPTPDTRPPAGSYSSVSGLGGGPGVSGSSAVAGASPVTGGTNTGLGGGGVTFENIGDSGSYGDHQGEGTQADVNRVTGKWTDVVSKFGAAQTSVAALQGVAAPANLPTSITFGDNGVLTAPMPFGNSSLTIDVDKTFPGIAAMVRRILTFFVCVYAWRKWQMCIFDIFGV